MEEIVASDLKTWDVFKTTSRQRKWRPVARIYDLGINTRPPRPDELLICLGDCSQIVLKKDQKIFVNRVPFVTDDLPFN